MKTTEVNNTEIFEMMQTLMNEGMQGFPTVMARMYNLAMQFEREMHLNASKYERTEGRTGYANGYKPKTITTGSGKIQLQIPQVRGSDRPFYPKSLERGSRSDRALRMAVAEMYVKGVSTRKVQSIFSELCDVNITADQVSRATQELDAELSNWRNRPIGEVKVLFLDATYHKVRMDGIVVPMATFIVTGVLADGHRSVLAVDSEQSESEVHWRKVLAGLKERGMHGVQLIISDNHDGLKAARQATLPGIPWQRCQMHLQQNAQAYVTKASLKGEVASDIRSVFNARSLEDARRLLAEMVVDTENMDEKEQKDYYKSLEKKLMAQYKPRLKKLTYRQGKLLVRLIDRECERQSYSLIRDFLGKKRAFFWNMFGKMFGISLKARWEPDGKDKELEDICILVEQGLV